MPQPGASGVVAFKNEAFSFFTHAGGALAAALGLFLLVSRAADAPAVAALSVYGGTMILMFTTSAFHHVAHAEEGFFRRLDMSAIYLFIAGSYTPFCVLALPRAWGVPMLLLIWGLALAGVMMRWTLPKTPRWITASLYLGMGWISLLGIYPLVQAVGWMPAIMLCVGGVVYSVGAIVYARGSPDPWPKYVGYHGLWHVFVLVGAGIHFTIVWGFLR